MAIDHEAIRAQGWQQGSILTAGDTQSLAEQFNSHCPANSRLIAVSHSCDIVHSGPSEVHVEFCMARPLQARPDGNKTHGKNPRSLHVPLTIDGHQEHFEILGWDRLRVERRVLQTLTPDPSAEIAADDLDVLLRWIADRYLRTALPDAFNSRIEQARRKIARSMESDGADLLSVLISMSSWDELPVEANYRLTLIGVMRDDAYHDHSRREIAERALTKAATALQACSGIEVDDSSVEPESRITLASMRMHGRFELDYLSLRSEPRGELPAYK